jgi:hypothetical protein
MALFGYPVEPDFDLGKEQRRDRLLWCLFGGLALLGLLFLIFDFSRMVFIGYALSILTYGDSVYVQRNHKLRERWLWKTVLATVPVHLGLLVGISWLTSLSQSFASTGFGSVGFVALCFACEAIFFDRVAARFESRARGAASTAT